MELNQMQLDVMKEIGNIGSGNAATALSMLLQRRIDMSVPNVWLTELEGIADIIGQLDSAQAVVYVKVEGEVSGKAVFFFPLESAEIIIEGLFYSSEQPDLFTCEIAQSALKEIGNIMVSSFLIALTQLTGIQMQPSVPVLAIDMAGAIMDAILLDEGLLEDNVLFIDTQISGIPEIEGQFMYIPDEGSLTKLLGALGV
jgi:CheC, inhibitor of MCP methylation